MLRGSRLRAASSPAVGRWPAICQEGQSTEPSMPSLIGSRVAAAGAGRERIVEGPPMRLGQLWRADRRPRAHPEGRREGAAEGAGTAGPMIAQTISRPAYPRLRTGCHWLRQWPMGRAPWPIGQVGQLRVEKRAPVVRASSRSMPGAFLDRRDEGRRPSNHAVSDCAADADRSIETPVEPGPLPHRACG